MSEWHYGPPPSIGWWPTESDWFRWWDGECWSQGCKFNTSAKDVSDSGSKRIEWELSENCKWRHWHDCREVWFADKSKLPENV